MKHFADAMTNKFSYHSIAKAFDIFLDGVTDVSCGVAWFCLGDALHKRFFGDVKQFLGFCGDFTDGVGPSAVGVPAIFVDPEV